MESGTRKEKRGIVGWDANECAVGGRGVDERAEVGGDIEQS